MLIDSTRVSFVVKVLFGFSILLCFQYWNSRIDQREPDLEGLFIRIVTYTILRFQIYPEVKEQVRNHSPSINPCFLRRFCFTSDFRLVPLVLPFLSYAVVPRQTTFQIKI